MIKIIKYKNLFCLPHSDYIQNKKKIFVWYLIIKITYFFFFNIVTCSIRENAEQKIWNRLKEYAHIKKRRPHLQIGILGCMAERLKEK